MPSKAPIRNKATDALFDAILTLETREECYHFFEDLCTVKELSDMAQRLQVAKFLLDGSTYEQIVKTAEIPLPPSAGSIAASSMDQAATEKPLKRRAQQKKHRSSNLFVRANIA